MTVTICALANSQFLSIDLQEYTWVDWKSTQGNGESYIDTASLRNEFRHILSHVTLTPLEMEQQSLDLSQQIKCNDERPKDNVIVTQDHTASLRQEIHFPAG